MNIVAKCRSFFPKADPVCWADWCGCVRDLKEGPLKQLPNHKSGGTPQTSSLKTVSINIHSPEIHNFKVCKKINVRLTEPVILDFTQFENM